MQWYSRASPIKQSKKYRTGRTAPTIYNPSTYFFPKLVTMEMQSKQNAHRTSAAHLLFYAPIYLLDLCLLGRSKSFQCFQDKSLYNLARLTRHQQRQLNQPVAFVFCIQKSNDQQLREAACLLPLSYQCHSFQHFSHPPSSQLLLAGPQQIMGGSRS